MSKRPLPSSSETNRKKSSFRFAHDPSEVVANSTKVGQLASGRLKQTKQNTPSTSIAPQVEPLPLDQPLQDDLNSTDAIQVDQDESLDVLSKKQKRKKRTNTTSVISY
jgi:FtsZ-interacting cell division protein ZipA